MYISAPTTIIKSTHVGIATDDDGVLEFTLDINGECRAVAYNLTSDYRIKQNVADINIGDGDCDGNGECDGICTIQGVDGLRPVTYINTKTSKQNFGLIAHEIQTIYPNLVSGEKTGDAMQSVNYIGLIPILIKEIQTIKTQLADIQSRCQCRCQCQCQCMTEAETHAN